MDEIKLFKIGEFAKKAGVSKRSVEHYTQTGLLKEYKVNDSNYRFYPEEDIQFIKTISPLIKNMSLPIVSVLKILDAVRENNRDEILAELKKHIDVNSQRKNRLEVIFKVSNYAKELLNSSSNPVDLTEWTSQISEKYLEVKQNDGRNYSPKEMKAFESCLQRITEQAKEQFPFELEEMQAEIHSELREDLEFDLISEMERELEIEREDVENEVREEVEYEWDDDDEMEDEIERRVEDILKSLRSEKEEEVDREIQEYIEQHEEEYVRNRIEAFIDSIANEYFDEGISFIHQNFNPNWYSELENYMFVQYQKQYLLFDVDDFILIGIALYGRPLYMMETQLVQDLYKNEREFLTNEFENIKKIIKEFKEKYCVNSLVSVSDVVQEWAEQEGTNLYPKLFKQPDHNITLSKINNLHFWA